MKCCGNCNYYEFEEVSEGYICVNGESDHVGDSVEEDFVCDNHEMESR